MNEFRADLHIHSRFSRATSKKLSLPLLAAWAQLKGISVLGTGDLTHQLWRDEIREHLVFDEVSGLYSLKQTPDLSVVFPGIRLPTEGQDLPVRFMLQGEVSSIYKRGGKVRKVHNLVFMPNLDAAERFSMRLGQMGNLRADGRPIVGVDSRDLLEMVLETDPKAFLIPAHIWTPWFSLFGSKSGFNDIRDCFGDLTEYIFALETGLSSDPAMNRMWSGLDSFRLVSNSDAHSGDKLGREVNIFAGDASYDGILTALKTPEQASSTIFKGTLEFFPHEGKYFDDGHRSCNVHLSPQETRELDGKCPVCGGLLTVGVLSRVMELADRKEPEYRDGTVFRTVVPLTEVMGEFLGVGAKTKKVGAMYTEALSRFGSELYILQGAPEDALAAFSPLLGEAVGRMRRGDVHVQGGYDGEFGVIRMFTDAECREILRGTGVICRGRSKGQVQSLSLLVPEVPAVRQRREP